MSGIKVPELNIRPDQLESGVSESGCSILHHGGVVDVRLQHCELLSAAERLDLLGRLHLLEQTTGYLGLTDCHRHTLP